MLNVLYVIIILNLNNDEVMSRSTRGEQVLEYLREFRWSTAVLTASARKCKHAQHHWLQCNNALIMVMIVTAALLYQRLHLHHLSVLSNKD